MAYCATFFSSLLMSTWLLTASSWAQISQWSNDMVFDEQSNEVRCIAATGTDKLSFGLVGRPNGSVMAIFLDSRLDVSQPEVVNFYFGVDGFLTPSVGELLKDRLVVPLKGEKELQQGIFQDLKQGNLLQILNDQRQLVAEFSLRGSNNALIDFGVCHNINVESSRHAELDAEILETISSNFSVSTLEKAKFAYGLSLNNFGYLSNQSLQSAKTLVLAHKLANEYGNAIGLLEDNFGKVENLFGKNSSEFYSLHHLAGEVYFHFSEYRSALEHYLVAAQGFERLFGIDDIRTNNSIKAVGVVYTSLSEFELADEFLLQANKFGERFAAPNSDFSLGVKYQLASNKVSIGQFTTAENLYLELIDVINKFEVNYPQMELSIKHGYGLLLKDTSRFGQAERLLVKVLKDSKTLLGSEHPDTLNTASVLATLYSDIRDFESAELLLREVLEVRKRVLGENNQKTLLSIGNLAALLDTMGAHAEAGHLLQEFVTKNTELLGPNHLGTLTGLDNLALNHGHQGNIKKSLELHLEVYGRILDVFGENHPDTITSLSNLAGSYRALEKHDEAHNLITKAISIAEENYGPEHGLTLVARSQYAENLLAVGNISGVLEQLKLISKALSGFVGRETLSATTESRRREIVERVAWLQSFALNLALDEKDKNVVTFASNSVLDGKKRIFYEDAFIARNSIYKAPEEIVRLTSERRKLSNYYGLRKTSWNENNDIGKKVSNLVSNIEAISRRIRLSSGQPKDKNLVDFVDVQDLADEMNRDQVLIELKFFNKLDSESKRLRSDRWLSALVVTHQGYQLIELIPESDLSNLRNFVVDMGSADLSETPVNALLHEAYQKIIAPLDAFVSDKDEILISTDGWLGAVPFSAFKDKKGRLLIETKKVRIISSHLNSHDERPAPSISPEGILTVGNVGFGNKERCQHELTICFPELRFSEDEAESIRDLYRNIRSNEKRWPSLRGNDANEAQLQKILGKTQKPKIIHFATHAFFMPNGVISGRPLMQAGIALHNANEHAAGGSDQSGLNNILHAEEIASLNLTGVDLVVLSACETAMGVADYSEGLEGLPRAFQIAGADNILASIWPVGDKSSKEFMEKFYWEMIGNGSAPNEALRTTKLHFYREGKPFVFWAPYVLFEPFS